MSRRKGANHERSVITWLRSLGRPHIERRIMGMAEDSGDVCGWPGVVIECKNAQRIELAAWVDQLEAEITLAEADTGVLIVKRRGVTDPGDQVVAMTMRDLVALLTGERP